jgi:hypothetical protein
MELTDEIEQQEVFDEAKQEDIFYSLLNGKTVKETIETSRGKFVVKLPKQKDLIAVDRRVAYMRGGIPAMNFDEAANFALQKVAYLDVVIESGEAWFNNLKKNKNFTWGDMPDANFIDEVYVKAWSFRSKVQTLFTKNEADADRTAAEQADVPEAVGDGLFSDVAGSAHRD